MNGIGAPEQARHSSPGQRNCVIVGLDISAAAVDSNLR